MKILAIDTSCDETAAAVTENTTVLSNIIWSQASLHAKFGGVYPSLARREHEKKIDWIIKKALGTRHKALKGIDAVAVTIGPGLSIALGVGVNRAKELAKKYNKKLIAVNHLEGHLLSPIAEPKTENLKLKSSVLSIKYPALGLIVSGGNTLIVKINKIGSYETLAETQDDALGEALDKAARVLGLGYPGGPVIEKLARSASSGQAKFTLPIPLAGDKIKNRFSYSGLKTAFIRLLDSIKNPDRQDIADLAAVFQNTAFEHIINVLKYQMETDPHCPTPNALLLGGGVAGNILLRSKLRKLLRHYGVKLLVPYSKKLCGDNAAMIGVCAYFKAQKEEFINANKIDRSPRLKI